MNNKVWYQKQIRNLQIQDIYTVCKLISHDTGFESFYLNQNDNYVSIYLTFPDNDEKFFFDDLDSNDDHMIIKELKNNEVDMKSMQHIFPYGGIYYTKQHSFENFKLQFS